MCFFNFIFLLDFIIFLLFRSNYKRRHVWYMIASRTCTFWPPVCYFIFRRLFFSWVLKKIVLQECIVSNYAHLHKQQKPIKMNWTIPQETLCKLLDLILEIAIEVVHIDVYIISFHNWQFYLSLTVLVNSFQHNTNILGM